MTNSRTSARAMKRLAAEYANTASTAKLPDELEELLCDYSVASVDPLTWSLVKDTHRDVMRRSQIIGKASFIKQLGVNAKYLVWRQINHLPIEITAAYTKNEIDFYFMHALDGSDRTRNDYRSRLHKIAEKVNPELGAHVKVPVPGHCHVRAGYTDTEMAEIRHLAHRQRSPRVRRQLCAIVGLCAGAGLSPTDLRPVRTCHIHDHGIDGIEVEVTGPSPRTVWVRREYEELVRIGIEGLRRNDLVVGVKENRKNVTTGVIADADWFDGPALDASRLRSTWLTWLMTRRAPLQLVLEAAGLKTARSLCDLLNQMPEMNHDLQTELRGVEP